MLQSMMQKEYLIGGLIVVGILVIRAIVNLFMTPSLNTIAKTCSKCIPQMGEDDKLTIWGYEAAGEYTASKAGMSDGSYYVSRVEAYCRAARINYTKLASQGGSENPRGKVPFANIEGTMVDDSAKIIAGIQKKYNVNLDKDLTPQQLATGHLIRETLHGSLYWVAAHFMFHNAEGRRVFRSELEHAMPPVIIDIVYAMAMKAMHKNLHGQGIGRMPEADIIEKGKQDLAAFSISLGNTQDFLFGTKTPTSVDCDLYCMLACLFGHGFFSKLPWVVEARKEYSNLDTFYNRMKDILYPELKEKSA